MMLMLPDETGATKKVKKVGKGWFYVSHPSE
jgi:hypothetical protein